MLRWADSWSSAAVYVTVPPRPVASLASLAWAVCWALGLHAVIRNLLKVIP